MRLLAQNQLFSHPCTSSSTSCPACTISSTSLRYGIPCLGLQLRTLHFVPMRILGDVRCPELRQRRVLPGSSAETPRTQDRIRQPGRQVRTPLSRCSREGVCDCDLTRGAARCCALELWSVALDLLKVSTTRYYSTGVRARLCPLLTRLVFVPGGQRSTAR